ncbi:DUF4230 domain-containing protein [Empedobacter falsenii]|uniref:DUF4230 domain-containing protein n=1 Tax=Empedobacter falsenii TaxID=343874 RepID=UPI0025789674|nr:DUF4230 domain-containing protein [Empedobacter falsenii]MDM1546936.1 DUF4230 domain-containing protein [Empedobacter falsenii]
MNNLKKIILVVVAFIFGVMITYFIMDKFKSESYTEQSHVIAYQIERMNKMIVAEQTYSDLYNHKSKKSLPGLTDIFSADKKVTLLVKAKAQATYDLKKMDIELDSVNKKIIIKSIPPVEIQVYPDVSFYDMDQSVFNKFSKDDLNGIKKRAVEHVEKTVDQTKLKQEAHQQLIQNLGDLYFLAKTYGWKIEDKTSYANELNKLYD